MVLGPQCSLCQSDSDTARVGPVELKCLLVTSSACQGHTWDKHGAGCWVSLCLTEALRNKLSIVAYKPCNLYYDMNH